MSNTLVAAPARLTLKEFAERENVPIATVRTWLLNDSAPRSYRMGRRRVMDLEDVLRWETELRAAAR